VRQLEKSVAVVTGGGGGLGKATAERLFKDGFSVAVVDRDGATARAVAETLDPRGKSARAYTLDVSSVSDVAVTLTAISSDLGVPTALVNNAGIYPDHALLDMPVEAWDQVMSVNLRGTFLCTQAFGRLRRDMTGGAIVNLASAAECGASTSSTAFPAAFYYCSKISVLALELRGLMGAVSYDDRCTQ
jgi:3-oxoacyl-[acyl-carrier protein] reductase